MTSLRCDGNERTTDAKWQIVLASIYAALVFLAYIQPFDLDLPSWRSRPLFNGLATIGLLAPTFPAAMVVLRFVFSVRPSQGWSEGLAVTALLGGLI